jgi:hypothetical protein
MLASSGLPQKLWAEAVFTACHVLNRTPCRGDFTTTPYEIWFKKKPDMGHLRIKSVEVKCLFTFQLHKEKSSTLYQEEEYL